MKRFQSKDTKNDIQQSFVTEARNKETNALGKKKVSIAEEEINQVTCSAQVNHSPYKLNLFGAENNLSPSQMNESDSHFPMLSLHKNSDSNNISSPNQCLDSNYRDYLKNRNLTYGCNSEKKNLLCSIDPHVSNICDTKELTIDNSAHENLNLEKCVQIIYQEEEILDSDTMDCNIKVEKNPVNMKVSTIESRENKLKNCKIKTLIDNNIISRKVNKLPSENNELTEETNSTYAEEIKVASCKENKAVSSSEENEVVFSDEENELALSEEENEEVSEEENEVISMKENKVAPKEENETDSEEENEALFEEENEALYEEENEALSEEENEADSEEKIKANSKDKIKADSSEEENEADPAEENEADSEEENEADSEEENEADSEEENEADSEEKIKANSKEKIKADSSEEENDADPAEENEADSEEENEADSEEENEADSEEENEADSEEENEADSEEENEADSEEENEADSEEENEADSEEENEADSEEENEADSEEENEADSEEENEADSEEENEVDSEEKIKANSKEKIKAVSEEEKGSVLNKENEAVSKEENEADPEEEKEAISEEENEAVSEEKNEADSEDENEAVSEDENEAVSEEKNEEENEADSEEENEAVSEEENEADSEDENEAVSEDENEAVSEEENEADPEKEAISEEENEADSEEKNEAVSEEKNEAVSEEKNEAVSEEKNEAVSEDKNEAVSKEENEAVSEEENEAVSEEESEAVSEEENEADSEEENEADSEEENEAVSEEENEAVSEEENEAVSEEENEAVSEEENEAVSEEENEAVSEEENEAVSEEENEAVSEEENEAVSEEENEAVSEEENEAVSDKENEAVSEEENEAVSEEENEAVSEEENKAVSEEENEVNSEDKIKAVSEEAKEAVSEDQIEAVSEEENNVLYTEDQSNKLICDENKLLFVANDVTDKDTGTIEVSNNYFISDYKRNASGANTNITSRSKAEKDTLKEVKATLSVEKGISSDDNELKIVCNDENVTSNKELEVPKTLIKFPIKEDKNLKEEINVTMKKNNDFTTNLSINDRISCQINNEIMSTGKLCESSCGKNDTLNQGSVVALREKKNLIESNEYLSCKIDDLNPNKLILSKANPIPATKLSSAKHNILAATNVLPMKRQSVSKEKIQIESDNEKSESLEQLRKSTTNQQNFIRGNGTTSTAKGAISTLSKPENFSNNSKTVTNNNEDISTNKRKVSNTYSKIKANKRIKLSNDINNIDSKSNSQSKKTINLGDKKIPKVVPVSSHIKIKESLFTSSLNINNIKPRSQLRKMITRTSKSIFSNIQPSTVAPEILKSNSKSISCLSKSNDISNQLGDEYTGTPSTGVKKSTMPLLFQSSDSCEMAQENDNSSSQEILLKILDETLQTKSAGLPQDSSFVDNDTQNPIFQILLKKIVQNKGLGMINKHTNKEGKVSPKKSNKASASTSRDNATVEEEVPNLVQSFSNAHNFLKSFLSSSSVGRVVEYPDSMENIPKKVSELNSWQLNCNLLPKFQPFIEPPPWLRLTIPAEGYCCQSCGDVFFLENSLIHHRERRSVWISFECGPCGKKVSVYNRCAYKDHMRKHQLNQETTIDEDTVEIRPMPPQLLKLLQPIIVPVPKVEDEISTNEESPKETPESPSKNVVTPSPNKRKSLIRSSPQNSSSLQCFLCNKMFHNVRLLMAHMRTNQSYSDQRVECRKCHLVLPSVCAAKAHILTHPPANSSNISVCPECGSKCSGPRDFVHHLNSCGHQYRRSGILCSECQVCFFSSTDEFVNHWIQEHCNKSYKCVGCSSSFESPVFHQCSKSKEHQLTNFKCMIECSLCSAGNHLSALDDKMENVKRHMVENHSVVINRVHYVFKSKFCSNAFQSKDELRAHHDREHRRENHYRTKTCSLHHKVIQYHHKFFQSQEPRGAFVSLPFALNALELHDAKSRMIPTVTSVLDASLYPEVDVFKFRPSQKESELEALKPCICYMCGTYTGPKDFFDHQKTCEGKDAERLCQICGFSAAGESFSRHCLGHIGDGQLLCIYCNGSPFASEQDLESHFYLHLQDQFTFPVTCPFCSNCFSFSESVFQHMKDEHDPLRNVETFNCDRCGQSFQGECNFESHLSHCSTPGTETSATVSSSSSKLVHAMCSVCTKGLNTESFSKHMIAHLEDGLLVCTICDGLQFPSSLSLLDHLKEHSETLSHPWFCRMCGSEHKNPQTTLDHIKEDHGFGDIKCSECDMIYNYTYQLKRHKGIVHQICPFAKRRYICWICRAYDHVKKENIINHFSVLHGLHVDQVDEKAMIRTRGQGSMPTSHFIPIKPLGNKETLVTLKKKKPSNKTAQKGTSTNARQEPKKKVEDISPIPNNECSDGENGDKKLSENAKVLIQRLPDSLLVNKEKQVSTKHSAPVSVIEKEATKLNNSEPVTNAKVGPTKKILKCNVCSYKTSSKSKLRLHKKKHENEVEGFTCDLCGQLFVVEISLTRHLFFAHKQKVGVPVSTVKRPIVSENDLPEAPANKRTSLSKKKSKKRVAVQSAFEEKPKRRKVHDLQCSVCYIEFTEKNKLTSHLRTHGMAFLSVNRRRSFIEAKPIADVKGN